MQGATTLEVDQTKPKSNTLSEYQIPNTLLTIPNTKYQILNTLLTIPNTKYQILNTLLTLFQIPNTGNLLAIAITLKVDQTNFQKLGPKGQNSSRKSGQG